MSKWGAPDPVFMSKQGLIKVPGSLAFFSLASLTGVGLAFLLLFMPCWCQENHNVDMAGGKDPVRSSLHPFPTSKKQPSFLKCFM